MIESLEVLGQSLIWLTSGPQGWLVGVPLLAAVHLWERA